MPSVPHVLSDPCLLLAVQGGFYMVVLFDQYVLAWTPIVVAVVMCVVVTWVYGLHTLINNVRAMLGSAPSLWWRTLWKYVTPLVLTVRQGLVSYFHYRC